MWHETTKYKKKTQNYNEIFSQLKGELEDREAKITLCKFLRQNLYLTTYLLTGIKLSPYQEITLKGMFNRNFSMCVWGRGCAKSFIASVYCVLQCIFEPNTKILIAGPTFRTARAIFNNIEKMSETKGAELLFQAFGAKSKRNDLYEWDINGGSIRAIPLSGEKIRGFRANILVLDEFLLLPEEIIKNVLMPFLVAPQDMKRRIDIREMEDLLIKEGKMKEEDRMVFVNNSKMIALSSASYTFENLYKTYQEWVNKITSPEKEDSTYFVSQLGYEALPAEMIDKTIIEEAQSGGTSHSAFLREYCAQFTDGSDSYFSAKKMEECTLKDEYPHTLVRGSAGKRYVIGIDPNMSDSPNADYFAMAVLEIDDDTGIGILVHTYSGLGNLNNHVKYLAYLMSSFNVVLVICDNAGADIFLDTCNNEYLQACIDYKKVLFASRTCSNEKFFSQVIDSHLPRELIFNGDKQEWTNLDFIENQDDYIYQTKKQCALVEYTTSSRGMQNFDLPQHLKRGSSATRARKDNYSAFMLANWGLKCYNEIMKQNTENNTFTFTPVMF